MKKIIYGGLLLSIFLMSNSTMATIENSANGIKNMISALQPLKNGTLQTAIREKVGTIIEDTKLDVDSKVVLLDALNRHTALYSPQSSLLILQKIKEIVGDSTFGSEQGYGIYLWNWMYDPKTNNIKESRYDIDIIISMISKLYGTEFFDTCISPILIERGLEFYIPSESMPSKQFQWHK